MSTVTVASLAPLGSRVPTGKVGLSQFGPTNGFTCTVWELKSSRSEKLLWPSPTICVILARPGGPGASAGGTEDA